MRQSIFIWMLLVAVAAWVPLSASPVHSATETTAGEPPLEDQFKELTEEWQRRIVNSLREILAEELHRLKAKDSKASESVHQQISDHKSLLKNKPDNAATHFALGTLYHDIGDGANAIIHTQKAEKLFEDQKDLKGVAESRRNLRNYLKKFGYRPEDFNLTQ